MREHGWTAPIGVLLAIGAALAACAPTTELVTIDPAAAARSLGVAPPAEVPGYVPDIAWDATPSASAVAAVYPAAARALGLSGAAGLECRLAEGGRLSECEVIDETPMGLGFGQAVQSLVPQFRAAPVTTGGAALGPGRRVRVGVSFLVGERHAGLGLCQATLLARQAPSEVPTAREAAAAELRASSPLLVPDLAAGRRRIDDLAPLVRTLARDHPEASARLVESCTSPRLRTDTSRLYPLATTVWVDEAGKARSLVRARWTAVPRPEQVLSVYPAAAQRAEVSGRTVVQCWSRAAGRLSDCRVIGETPSGYGFGVAALRLIPLFRVAPELVDGAPVDSVIVAPVAFLIH